jgi:DNA-binding LacI/PurR family transcriptional regulator
MPVTIKDIAQRAGVSPMTVSNVINKKGSVKAENKKAVLAAIKEMGYVPSSTARQLKQGDSSSGTSVNRYLGCIFQTGCKRYSDYFYLEIFAAIEEEVKRRGYHIYFCYQADDLLEDPVLANSMINKSEIDGLFLIGDPGEEILQLLTEKHSSLPVTCIDFRNTQKSFDYVNFDVLNASATAVEYLVERGFDKIALLGPDQDENRLWGYKMALNKNNIPFDPGLVVKTPTISMNDSMSAVKDLITSGIKPDAYLGHNDIVAVGIIKALRELDIKVPDDAAVIGINGDEIGLISYPTLSSIMVDKDEMGRQAVTTLLERINSPSKKSVEIIVPFELRIRESC